MDVVPLWLWFLLTLGLVLLCVEIGYRLGRLQRKRSHDEKEAPVGAMVGAILGLLAFFLAFTFGMAASRFDDRRKMVLEEANAIGTCYLRAELLPGDDGPAIRQLLRDYTDARLAGIHGYRFNAAKQKSETIHEQLWKFMRPLAEKHQSSTIVALFIQSLNDVIDIHSKRIMIGARSRIPPTIWVALYLVTVLSMVALGYHAGLSGTSRSPAILVLAFCFSAVMLLILDLDRPQEGMLTVSQTSMIELRQSMK